MKLYKITDKNGKTRTGFKNECQWDEGVTHTAVGTNEELCSDGFIHAYTDPYLAVFFNPIGGNYNDNSMLLWEARGRVVKAETDKVGCKTLTTIKQIEKPLITLEQRIEIAIKCAVQVYKESSFIKWANNWMNRTDRSAGADADAAAYAAAGAAAGAATDSPSLNILKIIKEVLDE